MPACLAPSFDNSLSPCQHPWAGAHLPPHAFHPDFPPQWFLLCFLLVVLAPLTPWRCVLPSPISCISTSPVVFEASQEPRGLPSVKAHNDDTPQKDIIYRLPGPQDIPDPGNKAKERCERGQSVQIWNLRNELPQGKERLSLPPCSPRFHWGGKKELLGEMITPGCPSMGLKNG